ncbi:hypothetical protein FN846DRAFT_390428 [Sphaerosporella brunnea]|uniref:Uncharacterized protein n=1 Tax=Sphaerosporella brunnea TaxID=1250544 RepID=A0A5J5F698_9PEZI|nr:hypothetical protein FN846DRAFT_390428 [Sphaerosporella brunnea]
MGYHITSHPPSRLSPPSFLPPVDIYQISHTNFPPPLRLLLLVVYLASFVWLYRKKNIYIHMQTYIPHTCRRYTHPRASRGRKNFFPLRLQRHRPRRFQKLSVKLLQVECEGDRQTDRQTPRLFLPPTYTTSTLYKKKSKTHTTTVTYRFFFLLPPLK